MGEGRDGHTRTKSVGEAEDGTNQLSGLATVITSGCVCVWEGGRIHSDGDGGVGWKAGNSGGWHLIRFPVRPGDYFSSIVVTHRFPFSFASSLPDI